MGGADHDLEVLSNSSEAQIYCVLSRGPGAASNEKIGDFRMKGDEDD